jgi:hypothetical protein
MAPPRRKLSLQDQVDDPIIERIRKELREWRADRTTAARKSASSE